MTREAALQVFDAVVANGFQATLSASNVDAADGAQYGVWVTGRFTFTTADIEVLVNIAHASGQELQVVLPPNQPCGLGISSPKDRPAERALNAGLT